MEAAQWTVPLGDGDDAAKAQKRLVALALDHPECVPIALLVTPEPAHLGTHLPQRHDPAHMLHHRLGVAMLVIGRDVAGASGAQPQPPRGQHGAVFMIIYPVNGPVGGFRAKASS